MDPFALVRRIKSKGPAPVHLWDPPYCGEIDLRISRDGTWFHEDKPIRRLAMMQLFASVLKREADGSYYLVTPVEKVKIKVDDCPFVVVGMDVEGAGQSQTLVFTTNTGETVTAGAEHQIRVETNQPRAEPHPILHIRGGMNGLINRAVFYRLVELAEQRSHETEIITGVWSDSCFFELGRETSGSASL